MNIPDGYTYTVHGDECTIDHTRTGMGCLNIFLGAWLVFWSIGCASLIRSYLTGGKMENGEPIPLWFVLAFLGAWFFVAFLLLYSNFARKRFRLTADMLRIETRLLLLNWSISIPREAISEIQQIKDGGEGDDSFPSWGLRIRSSAVTNTVVHRLMLFGNFRRKNRTHTILARLPYDDSKWLATILSDWSGVTKTLCTKPEAEPCDAIESRSRAF